jgi:hypothetical protein
VVAREELSLRLLVSPRSRAIVGVEVKCPLCVQLSLRRANGVIHEAAA